MDDIWTNEVIHELYTGEDEPSYITFGELKYSCDCCNPQIGVGLRGAYIYLNEDEVDKYIQDLRYIANVIFGTDKPKLEIITDE